METTQGPPQAGTATEMEVRVQSDPKRPTNFERLHEMAAEDVIELVKKAGEYGQSWKKRGGVGAFMMLVRKMDRIENCAQQAGYDIFIAAIGSGNVAGVLDDIGDLRRYLFLVHEEVEWLRNTAAAIGANADMMNSLRHQFQTGVAVMGQEGLFRGGPIDVRGTMEAAGQFRGGPFRDDRDAFYDPDALGRGSVRLQPPAPTSLPAGLAAEEAEADAAAASVEQGGAPLQPEAPLEAEGPTGNFHGQALDDEVEKAARAIMTTYRQTSGRNYSDKSTKVFGDNLARILVRFNKPKE